MELEMNTNMSESIKIWLRHEYQERTKNNPRFSIRAFARYLEIDASTLSQLLSGKRKPSNKFIERLSVRIGSSPYQFEGDSIKTPNDDTFVVLSTPHYRTLLDLISTKGFANNPKWISSRIDLSVPDVCNAIDRLTRLSIITNINGVLTKTGAELPTLSPEQKSQASKLLEAQVIDSSKVAMDEVSQKLRKITSSSFKVDKARITEARSLIENFINDMTKLLDNEDATEVYTLAVQLYPTTKSYQAKSTDTIDSDVLSHDKVMLETSGFSF